MTAERRTAQIAGWVFVALVVFSFLLQAQAYLAYVHRGSAWSATAFVARLPLLLLEHVMVAAALAALAAMAARRRFALVAFLVVLAAFESFVVVNQVVYKLFFTPVHWSQSEGAGGLGAAWDSIVAEIDPWFIVAAIVLVFLLVFVARVMCGRVPAPLARVEWGAFVRRRWVQAVLAMWLVAAIAAPRVTVTHDLHRHPLVSLVASAFVSRDAYRGTASGDLDSLRYGVAHDGAATEIAGARTALEGTGARRPNVVLIVLESVGAVQLLPGGLPDAAITPSLAALAKQAVVFDTLYVSFPSTTRTHLPLLTGGRTITHGSVDHDMIVPYTGPTLIGAARDLGYETAVFSAQRLDYEQLDTLIAAQPFHHITSYESMPADVRDRDQVHSWGANEKVTWDLMRAWLDKRSGEAPFFVELITNSTHHPYAEPGATPAGYLAALRDTDRVLGELFQYLDARGLANDTLIAITGDHGEAFGDRHAKNLGHKNRLYDENVRSFLVLARPGVTGPVRAARVARIDDVMPTLLARIGASRPDVPGQDVLADGYRTRIAYFHKSAVPAQWGLRDGTWKFISEIDGTQPELYDLARDPTEQTNLASARAAQVRAYLELCSAWYFRANDDFVAHTTAASRPRVTLTEDDLASPGPKATRFATGAKDEVATRFGRSASVVALTTWVAHREPRTLRATWRAPDGTLAGGEVFVDAGNVATRVVNPVLPPLAIGTWTFVLADERAVLHRATFVVE